jgi:outer membrane lipoprotein-sorting protein
MEEPLARHRQEDTMKKAIILSLAGSILFGAAAAAVQAQTAKDLLDKMIQAQGGRAALAAVKETVVSGTIDMVTLGMNGGLTMTMKEPDKMRLDIEIMGMLLTQAYDGEKAWMINSPTGGAAQEMDAKQSADFRRQALGNESFLNPEKFGITYALKGKEKINDKDYLVLEQAYQDGEKVTLYVDPDTYLPFKSRGKSTDQNGAEIESETFMTDYRMEGGLMVAHAMSVYQSGAEFMRMSFTKVAYNTGVPDAFFKMSK